MGTRERMVVRQASWLLSYVRKEGQYIIANCISVEKKVTLLQSVMRAKAYNVLYSLTAGIKSVDKTFAETVESLQNYLSGIC